MSMMLDQNAKRVARLGDVCEYGGRVVEGAPWLICG